MLYAIPTTRALQIATLVVGILTPTLTQAGLNFVQTLPHANSQMAEDLGLSAYPPRVEPPPHEDCYDPANLGTVGTKTGCNGLLIVDNGTGAYGIHTAVNSGIVVDGTTYDATSIFTGQVTDMSGLFYDNTTFNADIGYWDTSNVTTFNSMFRGAVSFNQSLNDWDVSSATDTGRMFFNATGFNQPLPDWDTGNVTNMERMFAASGQFNFHSFNQDIGHWNVSSATQMVEMFGQALSFDQDLSAWCVQHVSTYPTGFGRAAGFSSGDKYPIWGTCP